MPITEQVEKEEYSVNQKLRVYVQDVVKRERGDVQVIVSRKSGEFVKRLFEYEIPEIEEGLIEIKGVSRDAGNRTKIAVYSQNPNIDPVGSCIGQKGLRIENIKKELKGEKIDVVEWSEEPSKYIVQALLPAKIMAIDIDEDTKFAQVIVSDDQLTLAIGKRGQNVRLAVELTGWSMDIKTVTEFKKMLEEGGKDLKIDINKVSTKVEEIEEEFEETVESEIENVEDELEEINTIKEEEERKTDSDLKIQKIEEEAEEIEDEK